MTDSSECPKPRMMRVPCLNMKDGCKATVMYMGVRPAAGERSPRIRKLCPTCLECGMPSERVTAGYNFSKEMKSRKITARMPDGFFDPAGPIVACTVYMRTQNGGRVLPHPTGGG